MTKVKELNYKALDELCKKAQVMHSDDLIGIRAGDVVGMIQELKRQKFRLGKLGAKQAEERMKIRPQRVKVLLKNDDTLGWMYVCSNCKHFVCYNTCAHCGAKLDYSNIEDYNGKVEWEREEE